MRDGEEIYIEQIKTNERRFEPTAGVNLQDIPGRSAAAAARVVAKEERPLLLLVRWC